MAYLFKVENKFVVPTDEVLQIEPFKSIWDRDKTPNKDIAIKEFTYIEFMSSALKTNPYRGYIESKRKDVLLKEVMPKDWQEDNLVILGKAKIKEFQTEGSSSYQLYLSAITAKDKLQDFFNTFDMKKVNIKTGALLLKPKDVTSALQELDKTIQSINSLEKKVEEEIFESMKIKGQKEISPFANPDIVKRIKKDM